MYTKSRRASRKYLFLVYTVPTLNVFPRKGDVDNLTLNFGCGGVLCSICYRDCVIRVLVKARIKATLLTL